MSSFSPPRWRLEGIWGDMLQIFDYFEEVKSLYAKWLVPLAVGSICM